MTKVMIVAPNASSRTGLESLLSELSGVAVVGNVGSSMELNDWLDHNNDPGIDLVVVDFFASIESHLTQEEEILIQILEQHALSCIWLSDIPDIAQLLAPSSVPGWALLRSESDIDAIEAAMRSVEAGMVNIDRIFVRTLVREVDQRYLQQDKQQDKQQERNSIASSLNPVLTQTTIRPTDVGHSIERLTTREQEVLQLMAQGLANKQIGGKLHISLHTVKFHVAAILAKLEASSRTEAVALGARNGLVTL